MVDRLTFDEYQAGAVRTVNRDLSARELLANAALGLGDEAGEVMGLVKKHLYQGHALDEAKFVEELGDVLWYLAVACEVRGLTLCGVARANATKLKARYPGGFEVQRSVHREVDIDE